MIIIINPTLLNERYDLSDENKIKCFFNLIIPIFIIP